MGRKPCCSKEGLNRGAWTVQEDKILRDYVNLHGQGKWRILPERAGLKRCGKSCRFRWLNYLRPDIKRGNISKDEEELIIRLRNLLGNRWSLIAGRLPGRTDNEIKNYWNTTLRKKVQAGFVFSDSKTDPSGQENKNHHHRKAEAQSSLPSPPNNNVIRTKASKCSKVLLLDPLLPHSSMQMQSEDFAAEIINAETKPLLMDDADATAANGDKMKSEDGVLPFPNENDEKDLFMDLLLDFDIGEICFPEFLNSDFLNNHEDLMPLSEQPLFRTQKDLCDETNVENSSCFCEDKDNGS